MNADRNETKIGQASVTDETAAAVAAARVAVREATSSASTRHERIVFPTLGEAIAEEWREFWADDGDNDADCPPFTR